MSLKFEKKISSFTDAKYTIACNSGTSALYLAFQSIGLSKNDIVIMPSITFVSSYTISKIFRAKVYLADVDPQTGQMTPNDVINCCKKFKIKKFRLLVLMYNGGYPLNADKFKKLKRKYNCTIIEDACHALGASYKSKNKTHKIGSCKHSDISTFSFHPIKSITTCEGGAITTNSKKIFDKLITLRSIGMKRTKKHWVYNVNELGLNFRLSDIQCALGISQLNKLKVFINKRKVISKLYDRNFKTDKNISSVEYDKNINSSFHLYFIKLNKFNLKKKDKLLKYLLKKKIYFQYHYIPIYKFKIFKGKYIGKNAENFYNNTLSIPIYYSLSKSDQNFIIRSLKSYFTK